MRANGSRVLWTPTCKGRFNSTAAAAGWGDLYAVTTTCPGRCCWPSSASSPSAAVLLLPPRRRDDAVRSPAPSQPAATVRRRPMPPDASEQERRAVARQGHAGQPGPPLAGGAALDAKKTVVILFWNKSGVEDRSVKNSVDRLPAPRRQDGAIFTDKVTNLSRYTRITAAASVTQTPVARDREPEGPGRGPERLLRLPDDPPVRAERAPALVRFTRSARRGRGPFGPVRASSSRTPPSAGLLSCSGMHPFEQHLTEPHRARAVPPGAHVGSAGGAPCGDLVRVALVRP